MPSTDYLSKATNTDVPVLRRAAMDFLARREHSLFELEQKLSLKFPHTEANLLGEVLAALRDENLQSDERFTESYARYRKSRGFGYLHIKADLLARKVSASLIERYLLMDDAEWIILASALVSRKLRDYTALEFGSKQHRRLQRFLKSRGFTGMEIRKALENKLG